MTSPDTDRLVAAWLTYQRNWWAYSAMEELCVKDPESALLVLLRMVSAADNNEMLETIGAGPLEDLLQDHGSTVVAQVEAEAASNPKLRIALAHVWLPRSPDPVTARLVALGCDLLRETPQ